LIAGFAKANPAWMQNEADIGRYAEIMPRLFARSLDKR
jgi:hypothetical protein